MKDVKSGLDKAGQDLTGNESYKFGDFSKSMLAKIKELDIETLSRGALDKIMSYEFGSITKSVLTELGQQLLSSATDAGRKLSGNPDYQVGDFTRQAISKLEGAKSRAERLLALPDEVEVLKQVVMEQELLIQSLTNKEGADRQSNETLLLPDRVEDLKLIVLDNQEVIDVVLSSKDDEDNVRA